MDAKHGTTSVAVAPTQTQTEKGAALEDEQALATSTGDADAEGSVDENPPPKRQRLDNHAMDHDGALDDEAVLALAAHNGTTSADYSE